MNTINNKRKQNSIKQIETAFIKLLERKDLNEITVIDICSGTKVNRSTFYTNFISVYDLAEKTASKLEKNLIKIYQEESLDTKGFLKLFSHIKKHKEAYSTFYKLSKEKTLNIELFDNTLTKKFYDDYNIDYHKKFFNAGVNAIIKEWLNSNCLETPEELSEIIKNEYKSKEI